MDCYCGKNIQLSTSEANSDKCIVCVWPKQHEFIFSHFWRLEDQDEGAGRPGFFWGLSPWLAVGHTLTMFSHDCLFLRLVPLVFPNLLERHLDEGPPYQAHFSLITSLKALSQIWSHSEELEGRPSMHEFDKGRRGKDPAHKMHCILKVTH